MRKITVLMMAAVVVCVASSAFADPGPGPVLPVDFCAISDNIVANVTGDGPLAWLGDLLGDDAAILTGLACQVADINGPGDMGSPNGMLDAFELGLVKELIDNGAAYADLGAWTGQVQAQFIVNHQSLYTSTMATVPGLMVMLWGTIRGMVGPENCMTDPAIECDVPPLTAPVQTAIEGLFPDLMSLLAGFGVINDPDTRAALVEIADLLALCDLINEGSCLVEDIDIDSVQGWPEKLGKDGDADGDGVSNYQTYLNVLSGYEDKALTPENFDEVLATYIDAALDPTKDGLPPVVEPAAVVTGSSRVDVGGTITLNAIVQNGTPLSYQWEKQGEGAIPDATGASYVKTDAQPEDSGGYRVMVDTDNGEAISPWRNVLVETSSGVPVAGGFGLALLAAACGLGGTVLIRRKK